jgi:hypothetical protein
VRARDSRTVELFDLALFTSTNLPIDKFPFLCILIVKYTPQNAISFPSRRSKPFPRFTGFCPQASARNPFTNNTSRFPARNSFPDTHIPENQGEGQTHRTPRAMFLYSQQLPNPSAPPPHLNLRISIHFQTPRQKHPGYGCVRSLRVTGHGSRGTPGETPSRMPGHGARDAALGRPFFFPLSTFNFRLSIIDLCSPPLASSRKLSAAFSRKRKPSMSPSHRRYGTRWATSHRCRGRAARASKQVYTGRSAAGGGLT